jgi:hypothetical protein
MEANREGRGLGVYYTEGKQRGNNFFEKKVEKRE